MGLKVVIIEDEKPAARRLTRMLSELDIDVLQALHSVEESVEWLQNNDHPDLIFLDIQLSDGLSFEIFEVLDAQAIIAMPKEELIKQIQNAVEVLADNYHRPVPTMLRQLLVKNLVDELCCTHFFCFVE